MLILLMALLESDFLRFFIENRDFEDWEDTATSWLIAALVVSVLVAGLMLGYKALRKYMAANIREKTWSRGQTVGLIFLGIFPVFVVIWIVWYASRDFVNIVGVIGLLKGAFFSWVLYLLVMVVVHLASPWRREIL